MDRIPYPDRRWSRDHVCPDLIERPGLVEALVADQSPVVLVSGRSGAGKSQVLRDAVAAVRPARNVAGPREVMYTSPCLTLVLDGFADIVAQVLQAQGAIERVGDRLSRAIERLIESKGRDLAVAAGKELIGLIKARVGDEAGQALADAVKALHEESAQTLGARLDRARAETAIEVVVDFAREVAEVSEGRPALVVLDRCERLDEAGARLLADLAEMLPAGVQIWAGVRDDSGPGPFLMSTVASRVEIPPLDAPSVMELLGQRGLPEAAADQILEYTDGTALEVQAYVGLLERGSPEAVPVDDALGRDTAQRLAMLPPSMEATTFRLAALSDPLPERYLLRFTNGNLGELANVMAALATVGLLTAHGEGEWIHERRRRALLAAGEPEVVEHAITDAATAVWEYVQAGGRDEWLVELADLAAQASTLAEDDRQLRAVLSLKDGALAVLAALIELTEPSAPAVDGEALLSFARGAYPSAGLELVHLQEISEADLVTILSNDDAAAVVSRLSPLAFAVALGRAGRLFGQLPVPGIASVAFHEVLRPRIQPFVGGTLGVGRPSLRRLSYLASGREEDPLFPVPSDERRNLPPGLILRAAFGGRPLYGAFRFDSSAARDRALDAVTGLNVEFLDSRVSVTETAAHPMTAVPADRFLRAAERVIGRTIRITINEVKERIPAPFTLEERARLRVDTRRVLRELAGATLRGAMELDRPLSLHWAATESSHIEVEVQGGREVAVAHEQLSQAAQTGPYRVFHLAQELGLEPGEWISRVHTEHFNDPSYAPTNFDPVSAEIGSRRAAAIAFNRAQKTLPVPFDDSLVESIRFAFFREMTDARALAASVPLLGRRDWEIPYLTLYVVLAQETPDASWVPGARSVLRWAEALSESGHDECYVISVEGKERAVGERFVVFHSTEDALEQLPNFDSARVVRRGEARTHTGIARFLGHRADDLEFLVDRKRPQ